MTGFRAWFEHLEAKERSAVLALGTIGAGALLFVAGIQIGQAFAALV